MYSIYTSFVMTVSLAFVPQNMVFIIIFDLSLSMVLYSFVVIKEKKLVIVITRAKQQYSFALCITKV